ncbi:MAG: class I SAM-dependent methyltransferase [Thermoleophilia bacterium]|nr:class I SAM-dependent methyltransferase [Thermoleophilia bacterium]
MLLPLAQAGYEITGLDFSTQMLDRCRAKLEATPAEMRDRVSLVMGDMASFDLDRKFSAIFCSFNSFHHLRTVDDQLSCLESCHSQLAPQGMLVLDLFNPDPAPSSIKTESADGETILETKNGESCVDVVEWTEGRTVRRWMSSCVYNRPLQCNECEMTYEIGEADGSSIRVTETFPMRLMYRYELEHLLARCGFRMIGLYGDDDRSPFTDESVGMIAVAFRKD